MKKFLMFAAIAVLAFFGWAVLTYPLVGKLALENGAEWEARQYGLESQSIDIGDMQLNAWVGGAAEAPAIVMIHGFTGDRTLWHRFARHFVENYYVIIPELPGHGKSPYDPAWDYRISAQAQRVAGILDALGIEKAHLTGNSMGGYITTQFALDYPGRTLSAAPMDPAGVPSPQPSDMEKMLSEGNNPFLMKSAKDFDAFYPMTMERPPWMPDFMLDAVRQKFVDRNARHKHILGQIWQSPLLTPRLGELKMPMLLVWGRKDRLLHVSATEVWSAHIPQIQVKILEGIGHMPMVEAADQTAAVYEHFLSAINDY